MVTPGSSSAIRPNAMASSPRTAKAHQLRARTAIGMELSSVGRSKNACGTGSVAEMPGLGIDGQLGGAHRILAIAFQLAAFGFEAQHRGRRLDLPLPAPRRPQGKRMHAIADAAMILFVAHDFPQSPYFSRPAAFREDGGGARVIISGPIFRWC